MALSEPGPLVTGPRNYRELQQLRVSERLATPDDISSQFLWRTVRDRVLARRGLIEDGEALIQEALEIISHAEEPDSQAAVWADLAEVLATGGRWAEAKTALQKAASVFEAKGNIVSAAQAQQRLDTLVREGVPASAQQRQFTRRGATAVLAPSADRSGDELHRLATTLERHSFLH
jgi:tetratricopeptide (TPR) repeat protein